jgi:hypothetical protein
MVDTAKHGQRLDIGESSIFFGNVVSPLRGCFHQIIDFLV